MVFSTKSNVVSGKLFRGYRTHLFVRCDCAGRFTQAAYSCQVGNSKARQSVLVYGSLGALVESFDERKPAGRSVVVVPLRGAGDAAGFQAVSNLLGFTHPIILSLGNIIVPAAARARVIDGLKAARRVAMVHAMQGGLLLLPYFAVLLIFPRQLLSLFYGSKSSYVGLTVALRLLALAYLFYYLSLAFKFLLNALEENRAQFAAEVVSSSLLAIIIVPSVIIFGVNGAIVALGVWFSVRLAGNLFILRRVKS